MKQEINITDKNVREYVNDLKYGMLDLEASNSGTFGDFDLYRKAKAFNSLDNYEKNLICAYVCLGSYQSLEQFMNVKKSTIASEITRIKEKVIKASEDIKE